MINEHDMTKKMMKLLRENDIAPTNQTQRGETESVEVDKDRIKEFESRLSDFMGGDSLIRIQSYVLYPEQGKANLVGVIPNLGNMEFQYVYGGNEETILNTANMELNDKTVDVLGKIKTGYESFSEFTYDLLREYE